MVKSRYLQRKSRMAKGYVRKYTDPEIADRIICAFYLVHRFPQHVITLESRKLISSDGFYFLNNPKVSLVTGAIF